jgi:hypothetical protein
LLRGHIVIRGRYEAHLIVGGSGLSIEEGSHAPAKIATVPDEVDTLQKCQNKTSS